MAKATIRVVKSYVVSSDDGHHWYFEGLEYFNLFEVFEKGLKGRATERAKARIKKELEEKGISNIDSVNPDDYQAGPR